MYNLNNIKTLAAEKKVSMKQIFAYCDISEGGFYKSIENQSMNIKTIDKIAELLKVSVSELINDRQEIKDESPLKKNGVVSSPVTIYGPPDDMDGLKKIMYEQQVEIAGLLKEKVEWMEKAHSLEIELERVKNASAPDRDAIAG